MEPILEIRQLNSFYRQGGSAFSRGRTVQVLQDINVTIGRGEVLGLVGESGSGKSTLAKSILGMTEYQGEIVHHSRRPQMVFQDPYSSLNPAFSIRRIVEEPLRIYGKYSADERKRRAEEMLEAVGLGPEFHNRKPAQLSGGQRQRVSIAAAMIVQPRLVILETNVLFRPQKGASGLTMTLAAAGSYYFPVFTYHDIWKSILTGKEYPEENYKGFQFREVTNPYRGGAYMKETAAKEKISGTVEEYLEKIRSLCRKNQAELVLVSTPSPLNYNYRKYNTLKAYAEQREIPYEDMNLKTQELGIDWEKDSLDGGDHLNLSGAWKVTRFTGKYLHENFSLPDRREDENYALWMEEGEKYGEKAKEKLEAMWKDDKITGEEVENRRERSLPVYE